jgi:hypothetical protein
MLSIQAILLTTSLLIVLAMVAAVMCLAALRERLEVEPIRIELEDHLLDSVR